MKQIKAVSVPKYDTKAMLSHLANLAVDLADLVVLAVVMVAKI